MSALAISGLIYFEYLDTHVLNVLISFIWLEELLYFFLVQLQSQESSAFIIFLRHGKAVLQNFQSHYIFSGYNGGPQAIAGRSCHWYSLKLPFFFWWSTLFKEMFQCLFYSSVVYGQFLCHISTWAFCPHLCLTYFASSQLI